MKIREKLLLGFGFYVLFALVGGLVAYKDLRKITLRLHLVEIADDITNSMLEIRRQEKNYLLFKDEASLREFNNDIRLFRTNIDNMKSEIIDEIGKNNYDRMKESIDSYEKLFERVRENLILQEELASMTMATGKRVEGKLTGEERISFLAIRRLEKILMLDRSEETFQKIMTAYDRLNKTADTESYIVLLRKLFELYQDEKASMDMMRFKARELQSFTQNLSKKERAEISRILDTSRNMLLAGLIVVVLFGTIINVNLAISIATPIRRLERMTKRISEGDFSHSIEVTGKDEIASLGRAFNQMGERLNDTLTSLEKTVEKLQEKQAQLVEAEKLASIGKLAAGIAHEINNPLTYVLTFSSLMLEQMPEDDPRHERLRMIVKETRRARNIVRQVLSFAKEAPLKIEKIDVNEPVSEIIDSLIAQETFKDIELELDLAKDLPKLSIDPVQIGQVVLNIMLNAVHAITPPGKIVVTSRKTDTFVEVLFADTGKGIPEEHLKKIFDPFFTTKEKTKGTGLGLAVSYGIIKKHRGDIRIESTVGKGTTFIVRLPIYG